MAERVSKLLTANTRVSPKGRTMILGWVVDFSHLPAIDVTRWVPDEPKIDPRDYFQTSGDACTKLAVVEEDAACLFERLTGRLESASDAGRAGLAAAVAEVAAGLVMLARAYKDFLAARGRDVHLECEWQADRTLTLIGKNPREREE